jgi:hypothetical protein
VAEAEVALTAFPDRACADLAGKKDRSQAETDELAKCRKLNMRQTKTDRDGMFEFRELPAGWYSITIRWTQGNVPIFLGRESIGEYRIRTYQDASGNYGFWAESAAFELKAAEVLKKGFAGM